MLPIPLDILILSNGPGEVTTWVKPVVQELRQQLGDDRQQVRISVVLAPCPNATGKEATLVWSFPEVDRVQGAPQFNRFLLWGKTAENWDWHPQGVVIFLGGDQLFPVLISKRLGYRIVIYAEWAARWARWVDGFGVMNARVRDALPSEQRRKCRVVGDLMSDLQTVSQPDDGEREVVGFLPGSKAMKLTQGVPYTVAIADAIQAARPQTEIAIMVAPTLSLAALVRYLDPVVNPIAARITELTVTIQEPEGETPYLLTSRGRKIWLWTAYPNHQNLRRCQLCFTTIGASTAELGSLAVPMIMMVPVVQIDAMRAWDGLPGLIANLPGVGTAFAKGFNRLSYQLYQRRRRLFAWPNIWADAEIVPEMVGDFSPQDFADAAIAYLEAPEKLAKMRADLQRVRGEAGAAQRLVGLVIEVMTNNGG